ncbi:exo-beta-N-acetylmuramidase NamZ family protein [Parapedobacter sp. DT-150]|uniref:exo-beta-N-acetylmuramidase NamZ family protein n=1 Tax=Parapedobacter sp. DT-150 TaxID=3396162 RepID=UPI003F1A980B
MKTIISVISVIGLLTAALSCGQASSRKATLTDNVDSAVILPGADQLDRYLPLLVGKKVGLMGNQTSVVGDRHLVDVLLEEGVDLKFAFAPEHGFRGDIERGEKVDNTTDAKTGLPLHTLYGENEKADSIVGSVDVMIFDLQDVGARFYTYVASMHRVMQLCANQGKKIIVLDRPNPNGDQVDGPVRKDDKFKANISYHKIAMIHGLTVGELALMINGEGWLDGGKPCDLEVVPVANWDHSTPYELPVIPSPSLPNYTSVRLYMSLCLFEGTDFSIGRGTDWPFQVVGYPDPVFGEFTFTPGTRPGMAAHVEQQGNLCYGVDLRKVDAAKEKFTLKYLLDFYEKAPFKDKFFARPEFFDKLAGTDQLRKQILAGQTEDEIRASWAAELTAYKAMRKKYLLYEDFE